MKKKLKVFLLSAVMLTAVVWGTTSNNNDISASIGETFYENFADPNLAEAVAQRRGKNASDPITVTDVTGLTLLSIPEERNISDLSGIETFTSLNRMLIYSNPISVIPESIDSLTSLEILAIRYGSLSSLPDSLGSLPNLNYIDLSYNQLATLPNSITNLHDLESLYVTGNPLTALPDFSGSYPNFTNLHASETQLTTLPDSIGNLTSLKNLYLENNQLNVLPDSIGNLNMLDELKLSSNQLSSLPDSISQNVALRTLNLDNNQLTALPADIGNLTNLIYVSLYANQLTTLPDSFGQLTQIYWELNLSQNNITSLPASLVNLTNLYYGINLSDNNLTSFPAGLENLTQLNAIYLDDNQLDSVPAYIKDMPSLDQLSLLNNNFTSFPETLLDATQIGNINLGQNTISSIPVTLTSDNYPNLYALNLEDNLISELPDFPSEITYQIDINRNQLAKRIPDTISYIQVAEQFATLDSIELSREDTSDAVTFDLETNMPSILEQYEEVKGELVFENVTITKPNSEVVVIPGDEVDLNDQVNAILSSSDGDYLVDYNLPFALPSRALNPYMFLSGSTYRFPITVASNNGLVDEAALNGTVKDKDTLDAIENAKVELKETSTSIETRMTDVNGFYEMLDIEAKTYDIIVSADGYKTLISTVTIPEGETVTKDFLLEKGTGTIDERENPETPKNETKPSTSPKTGDTQNNYGVLMLLSALIIVSVYFKRKATK